MTLIVGFNDGLVADSIGIICSCSIITNKIRRLSDGTLFAVAGEQPTKDMVEAKDLDALHRAFEAQPGYFARSAMLAVHGGMIWNSSFSKGEFCAAVGTEGMAIGSYQAEYHARRVVNETRLEFQQAVDPRVLAVRVCNDINRLWGHTRDAQNEFCQ